MSIRDVVLTMVVFALLPVCLVRPWRGILVWSWLGYMNPHKLTWGFAREMPFASMVAVATLMGVVAAPDKERRAIPWSRETVLLAALWTIYAFTTVFAQNPDLAWPALEKISKILLFIFLTIMYFQSRERLHALFLVLALSLGFFGLKGGIWALRTGGANQVLGPEGTFLDGNTEIGLALNMTLPFLYYLSNAEPRSWLRRLLKLMFGFSIVAIIFTYSRGAVLGLPIVMAAMFLKSGKRIVGILVFAVAAFFVQNFAPPQWFAKMHTIETYDQDTSAMSRIRAWQTTLDIAFEHPLVGRGFWALEGYVGRFGGVPSAHSIYFAVLGDHGFPGLFVFVGLILSCLLTLSRLKRRVGNQKEHAWLANYCQMIQASLIGYAVSGAFLTMAYFDLFYHLVSFVILLRVIAVREGIEVVVPSRLHASAEAVLASPPTLSYGATNQGLD